MWSRPEESEETIMDQKTLQLIEYPKVLQQLADYAAFNASAEIALALQPSSMLEEVRERLAFTREARLLLSMNPDLRIGGVRDVRPAAERASRAYVLSIEEIVEIKDTLVSARKLQRPFFTKKGGEIDPDSPIKPEDLREDAPELLYPHLLTYARHLTPPKGLIDRISRVIGPDNQMMDSASPELSRLRGEIKVAHNRLMNKLQSMISNPDIVPLLQDALITQRGGRYVIPLRANFKNRIPAIIHDQSGTGQTLFVEPLAVVDLNNEWQELKLAERDEVRRILAELSMEIGEVYLQIKQIVDCVAMIDFALMVAKYAEDIKGSEPEVLAFRPAANQEHPGSHIHFIKARHPLLDPESVVPVDILLEKPHYALVITGPNTGGKTVTLKTTGLLVAMAQSGLHIPAASGAQFTIFENLLADIGDEQSIEQSLSTFSGHIKNIIHILQESHSQALVLLDELGSGTDPLEGEALAHAILSYLTANQIPCMIATHFAGLKSFAYATQGVVNAAMSFDLDTLSPTYRLMIGLPGRSNALFIAEREGLAKSIIAHARQQIDPVEHKAEDMLEDIQHQQEQMRFARESAEKKARDNERLQERLNQQWQSIEAEREKILQETRREAEDQLADMRKEMRDLKKRMKRAVRYAEKASTAAIEGDTATARAVKETKRQQSLAERDEDRLEQMEEKINQVFSEESVVSPSPAKPALQQPRPLKSGDRVYVHSFQKEGTLVQIEGDTAEVQLGLMRMKTTLKDIKRVQGGGDPLPSQPTENEKREVPRLYRTQAAPPLELDLRGERAEEALDLLRGYLEKAYLAQLPFVRILHGKGTGRLRVVIRQEVTTSRYVKSWDEAAENDGGSGVTIVRLKS
jgi:DNA mismatch repair protein MutS2